MTATVTHNCAYTIQALSDTWNIWNATTHSPSKQHQMRFAIAFNTQMILTLFWSNKSKHFCALSVCWVMGTSITLAMGPKCK